MSGNVSKNERLTARQQKAAAAIIEQPSLAAASRVIGISERQLYRWMKNEIFRAEVKRLEGEALNTAARRLLYLAEYAVFALGDLLKTPEQRGASVKARVAIGILDQLHKIRDEHELEERIQKLEKAVRNGRQRN